MSARAAIGSRIGISMAARNHERRADTAGLTDRARALRRAVAPVDCRREVGERSGRIGIVERGDGGRWGQSHSLGGVHCGCRAGSQRRVGGVDLGSRHRLGAADVVDRHDHRESAPVGIVVAAVHTEDHTGGGARGCDCSGGCEGSVAPVDAGKEIGDGSFHVGVGERRDDCAGGQCLALYGGDEPAVTRKRGITDCGGASDGIRKFLTTRVVDRERDDERSRDGRLFRIAVRAGDDVRAVDLLRDRAG